MDEHNFLDLGTKKDCPEDLKKIIDIVPKSENQRWLKAMNASNYFLAAFTSPYDIICEGIVDAMISAAQLYNDIVNGRIKSIFQELPRMHILWMLRMFMSHGYTYDFFKKAVLDASLIIDENEQLGEEKAYALY